MKIQPGNDHYQTAYLFLLSRLHQARLDAGLSQQDVADLLGKNQSYVSRSEQGARRVDLVELSIFADIYGKPLEYFLWVNVKKE